jgi:methyl-accepting chemotaxis protein
VPSVPVIPEPANIAAKRSIGVSAPVSANASAEMGLGGDQSDGPSGSISAASEPGGVPTVGGCPPRFGAIEHRLSAVTIVFVIGAVVSVNSLSSMSGTLHAGAGRMKLADEVSIGAYNMQGSQLMNVLLDGAGAANHAGDVQVFAADLAALGHDLITPADRAGYAKIQRAFAGWQVLNHRAGVLAAAHARRRDTALVTGDGAANAATDALSSAASALAATVAAEDSHSARTSRSSATVVAILMTVLGIALAIGIVLLLLRRIVGGVRQMLAAAKGLAVGEIDQTLDVRSRDEVGAMARAFEDMIDYLRSTAASAREMAQGNFAAEITPRSDGDALSHAFVEMRDRVGTVVRAISGTSQTLSHSSAQMATTTEEVGRAIDEIAGSVGSVASGAEIQVRAVAEARAMSDEVSVASRASSQRARETAAVAEQARVSAEQGERAVAQVDEAMRGVQSASEEAGVAIRQLGEKSSRIGGIVDTITGIAEQTNLLALNAAIEAARAGDQGRGFAVVAEEVRKLAEESQHAAASIAELVGEIRTETDRAVTVVERGAQQSDQSAQTVYAAREAFQRIRENVESMTERIEQIAASSEQIVESSERMHASVASVADVAEQSSAATEQVSASTEQTSASTQQIASSAVELSETATELRRLVSQFTL